MASASSSSARQISISSPKLYDAFISHRGPDVKDTLVQQLYDRLQEKGCRAFLDRQEIEKGDSIPSAIENGICSSRVQIAIFSEGYAQSLWCLNELVLMLKQIDATHALFIPVFYGVKPSELRHINNESQYAAAFFKYRNKGRNLDKLEEWRKALASAADISGYESQHHEDLCEKIVSRVLQAIKEGTLLDVAKYPVGLAELVQDFEKTCSETAGIVGIFGLGGIGKTTLAKELLNRNRSSYNASCFLSDVRESHARGEVRSLQSQLFKDLFNEDRKFHDTAEGIGQLKDRLRRAKHLHYLIILDDIDHEDQIYALSPKDMLGPGSLVIITTRDQSVLKDADVRYKMKEMNKNDAKELFCSHAFRRRDPPTAYEKLVESFVYFCQGLPLSLKVLGAHLYNRDEHDWELELDKVKKIQPGEIKQRLKISFDCLDREEKQIFIDVACLFSNKVEYGLKSKAIAIWKASEWSAELALRTLQEKCLLEVATVGRADIFKMHDHLCDLGRQIADELCPHELGPPRLWRPDTLRSMEAKGFKRILEETKGRCFHSIEDSSLGRKITYIIADTDLLCLEIGQVPGNLNLNLISIPSWIPLLKLHFLDVWGVENIWSRFQQQLQANIQATLKLRKLRIWCCLPIPPYSMEMLNHATLELRKLRIRDCFPKPPYSMEMLNHLEELEIEDPLEEADTTSLVQSLKQLSNLRSLELSQAVDLMSLEFRHLARTIENSYLRRGRDAINLDSSTSSCLRSLETIRLDGLETISNLVISGEMCPKLRSLVVSNLEYLSEMELKQLQSLNTLVVDKCYRLGTVSGLSSLRGLQSLNVRFSAALENLSGLSSLTELRQVEVETCTGLKSLSTSAHQRRLEKIRIVGCPELQSVEGVDELPELKNLVIQMPDDGYAYGLRRMLSVKETILSQKAMGEVSARLNANLFSEVVGAEAVSEIQPQKYWASLKIESSPSTITIYALLVTAKNAVFTFDSGNFCLLDSFSDEGNLLIVTFLLTQHDSEGIMQCPTIEKGFKATVKAEKEGKALTVLQRIIDRLYTQRTVPNLAA